jgi:DNA-binding response OmpR family regulator
VPCRILVAVDDALTAALLEQALAAAGLHTTMVGDGDAALRDGLTGRCDLLLLDVDLPDRDGLTVLRQLRGAGAGTPVILLSGHADATDIAIGLDAGADDYLTRPLRVDELLARIRSRLRATLSATEARRGLDDASPGGRPARRTTAPPRSGRAAERACEGTRPPRARTRWSGCRGRHGR